MKRFHHFMYQKILFICAFLFFYFKYLPAQKNLYQVAVIGFYNLENFYDTIDNPIVRDDEFLPAGARNYKSEVYWNKVNQCPLLDMNIFLQIYSSQLELKIYLLII